MNRYKTTEFTSLIQAMVGTGNVLEAFEIIDDCLPQNNPLRKELILLKSDFYQFSRKELLGLGDYSVELTRRKLGLLTLIGDLKRNYPETIPLKATPFVKERLERIVESKPQAAQQPVPSPKGNQGLFWVVLVGLAVALILTPQFCSKQDPEANRATYHGEPYKWAALLEDSTDEAYITRRFQEFHGRHHLEMLFIEADNSYWLVLLGENWSEEFVHGKISQSKNIKKAWPDAKPVNLSSICTTLRPNKSSRIWSCNK